MALLDTGLKEIGEHVSSNGTTKSTIYLNGTFIVALEKSAFENMTNVRLIYLNENNIVEINRLDYMLIYIKYITNPLSGKKITPNESKNDKIKDFLNFREIRILRHCLNIQNAESTMSSETFLFFETYNQRKIISIIYKFLKLLLLKMYQ